MFDFEKTVWMGGKDAGLYVGRSRSWVETWATPWRDEYVPKRIRYIVDEESGDRRYYRPDVEAKFRPKVNLPKRIYLGLRAARTTSDPRRRARIAA